MAFLRAEVPLGLVCCYDYVCSLTVRAPQATLLAQVLVTCNVIRDSANMALGNKAEFKDSNYAVYRFSDTGIYFNDDEKKKLVK